MERYWSDDQEVTIQKPTPTSLSEGWYWSTTILSVYQHKVQKSELISEKKRGKFFFGKRSNIIIQAALGTAGVLLTGIQLTKSKCWKKKQPEWIQRSPRAQSHSIHDQIKDIIGVIRQLQRQPPLIISSKRDDPHQKFPECDQTQQESPRRSRSPFVFPKRENNPYTRIGTTKTDRRESPRNNNTHNAQTREAITSVEEASYRSRFHGQWRQEQQKGCDFVDGEESEVTGRFGKIRGECKGSACRDCREWWRWRWWWCR